MRSRDLRRSRHQRFDGRHRDDRAVADLAFLEQLPIHQPIDRGGRYIAKVPLCFDNTYTKRLIHFVPPGRRMRPDKEGLSQRGAANHRRLVQKLSALLGLIHLTAAPDTSHSRDPPRA